ncbi:tRNA (N6-isopentenyl adenosine(37)-C2)-methylthiotransferase MiaB [Ferruginibacter sp. HRS2-29]|uniref:tRNA (N6-isopentenyl adenosine(37)-C2)-methylthiotransferase MiaB n=4 Tax=Ferruginibacter sp. HRS2-29 TaxID=2487334 RepID=UPI0020CF4913|nr:tRNA (N6-isopentenyl adenosine(37)-C2)-methylthiotransferase MiaB [Ferruginibacter sp. HRS2-29]MCP9751533.1 tRNA (N6-isopentenyl adenosine(37)-C2)-methylthiotransferase MiaB [Ferruginibacter sp. HRS2-29]
MQELLLAKTHDETRQGEAFAPAQEPVAVNGKRFYIESYGCAMNFADSEVVASILQKEGFGATTDVDTADLILINTCSIREKAEDRVRKRLTEFRQLKRSNPGLVVGVLGCMAERLKASFIEEEKLVDIVVGPDAYRSLPGLIEEANGGQKGVNVLLSREETYADIAPIRLNSNGVTAFVSIMRGCNNMCSFCVVPFTRGRERSRDAASIVQECEALFNEGYREVTLLGQNVDSYHWIDEQKDETVTFARLMELVANISPLLRIRFSTSHPKDITDDVLHIMAKYENICNYIHLPVQSGSTRVLQMMNRTYSREWYLAKVDRIREILPDCGISTDMIAGFCTETEEEHQESLSLMEYCKYDLAYLYFYSERPGTLAARRFKDDVPLDVKKRRLQELVDLYRDHSLISMQKDVGKVFKVLAEGNSKKSEDELYGRADNNKVVVFPKHNFVKGDYVSVKITHCTAGTLLGIPVDTNNTDN